jgi:hypothetical protein
MSGQPQITSRLLDWLDKVDPGTHRRIKGLRLVTAFGIAGALGTSFQTQGSPGESSLGFLAGAFALFASVCEAKSNRADSTRDLFLLCAAATLGAISMTAVTPLLGGPGRPKPEVLLILGSFLVSYLKRYGTIGGGVGMQIYLGQVLAYNAGLTLSDLRIVLLAGSAAAIGAVVPRVLSGPAERPVMAPPAPAVNRPFGISPYFIMGLQAAVAAAVIVTANYLIGLQESVWAISACTFVIAGSVTGTSDRVHRRIMGTLIGVPLGIASLPIAESLPLLAWCAAAVAMIIYAMALPERYDIACGAFGFTLMIALAASGVHSPRLLSARLWETLIGATLGLGAAMVVFPLRPMRAIPALDQQPLVENWTMQAEAANQSSQKE